MITCPYKHKTTIPERTCALRYRNANQPTVWGHNKQPGWDDSHCKDCEIGARLYSQGYGEKTRKETMMEKPDNAGAHVIDGVTLYEQPGRLAKSKPVLVDESGEIKGKICSKCLQAKLLADFYTHAACAGGVEAQCKICHRAYDKTRKSGHVKKTPGTKTPVGTNHHSPAQAPGTTKTNNDAPLSDSPVQHAAGAKSFTLEHLAARGLKWPKQVKISITIDINPFF